MRSIVTTFTPSAALVEKARAEATQRGTTRNQVVLEAIRVLLSLLGESPDEQGSAACPLHNATSY
jgi:hypothetical protein